MKLKTHLSANKKKELLTYCLFLLWPTLQFIIFYIIVNANSILLAFQEYSTESYSFVFASHPFETLKTAFLDFFTGTSGELHNGREVLLSIAFYACSIFISVPLGLMFSYYIYRKLPLSGAFRVVLFLPQIISAIVTSALFTILVRYPIPMLIYKLTGNDSYIGTGLLENSKTAFWTVVLYNAWFGFGTNVLMYSNKMSTIPPELLEAANIDGATGLKEFWHVVLPQVYPTLCVFLIAGFANLFVAQYNLFSLYPTYSKAEVSSFGYYFFIYAQRGSNDSNIEALQMYPYLSSMGIVIGAFTIPLVFGLRKLLAKIGPSEK